MILRFIAILALALLCIIANANAQTAAECQDNPLLCAKPKLELLFDLAIKLKQATPRPRYIPPKIKTKRVVKNKLEIVPQKPAIATYEAPKQKLVHSPSVKSQQAFYMPPVKLRNSWDGLTEIQPTKLITEDFADIDGQFIVDLNPAAFVAAGLDLRTISIADLAQRLNIPASQIRSVQRRFMLSIVLRATPTQASALAQNPLVINVNKDTKIKAAGMVLPLSWGLDRLDSPSLPLDGKFDRKFGEYQARVYLFDTGVVNSKTEFGTRVSFGADFTTHLITEPKICKEHGTEMASLIAGQTTGSAPKADIVELMVLPCEREKTGEASSLIEAAEWLLVREADFGDGKPAIANMSLAGKWSAKINSAVSILTTNGVVVVVAAGNNSQDACRFSPASAKDAITVAATGPDDSTPDFSNFGKCVDINAPGRLLTAMTDNAKTPYVTVNGTSGATALVSGLIARSLTNKGPQAAVNWLVDAALPASLWRKDATEMLFAQASPKWRSLCRVANIANLPLHKSQSGKIIGALSMGTLVQIEKTTATWSFVTTSQGKTGWIETISDGKPSLLRPDEDTACTGQQ